MFIFGKFTFTQQLENLKTIPVEKRSIESVGEDYILKDNKSSIFSRILRKILN